jgi:large subunit ribosomal protein L9
MKVLLLKDVYKLGRAGDVKRVADGYGRNYLIPQGLAVLATPGALKQAERIMAEATVQRQVLNEEMSIVADRLNGVVLNFFARASETGKLYGSITTQMIAESVSEKIGVEISRRQVDSQPLRTLGEHKVQIRLTVDLVPEVEVVVHAEGETTEVSEAEIEGEPATAAEEIAVEEVEMEVPEEGELEPLSEETAQETESEVELESPGE